MAFRIEAIPDDAKLFNRIHRDHLTSEGVISSQAFNQPRLSVNWEKYSTPERTADANSALVVSLVAKGCRQLQQTVEHTPIEPDQPFGPNQAHTEICGNKSPSIRRKLRDMATVAWRKIT
jgi:hypothetical protein